MSLIELSDRFSALKACQMDQTFFDFCKALALPEHLLSFVVSSLPWALNNTFASLPNEVLISIVRECLAFNNTKERLAVLRSLSLTSRRLACIVAECFWQSHQTVESERTLQLLQVNSARTKELCINGEQMQFLSDLPPRLNTLVIKEWGYKTPPLFHQPEIGLAGLTSLHLEHPPSFKELTDLLSTMTTLNSLRISIASDWLPEMGKQSPIAQFALKSLSLELRKGAFLDIDALVRWLQRSQGVMTRMEFVAGCSGGLSDHRPLVRQLVASFGASLQQFKVSDPDFDGPAVSTPGQPRLVLPRLINLDLSGRTFFWAYMLDQIDASLQHLRLETLKERRDSSFDVSGWRCLQNMQTLHLVDAPFVSDSNLRPGVVAYRYSQAAT